MGLNQIKLWCLLGPPQKNQLPLTLCPSLHAYFSGSEPLPFFAGKDQQLFVWLSVGLKNAGLNDPLPAGLAKFAKIFKAFPKNSFPLLFFPFLFCRWGFPPEACRAPEAHQRVRGPRGRLAQGRQGDAPGGGRALGRQLPSL